MSAGTLWITGEPEFDDLVNTDPLALLIGMLVHTVLVHAFSGGLS